MVKGAWSLKWNPTVLLVVEVLDLLHEFSLLSLSVIYKDYVRHVYKVL